LDVSTDAGRAAARLRVAYHLSRNLLANTLVKACRANGIRHICTGPAACPFPGAARLPRTQHGGRPISAPITVPGIGTLETLAEALTLVVARHGSVRDWEAIVSPLDATQDFLRMLETRRLAITPLPATGAD
jgi:hypothetical protein